MIDYRLVAVFTAAAVKTQAWDSRRVLANQRQSSSRFSLGNGSLRSRRIFFQGCNRGRAAAWTGGWADPSLSVPIGSTGGTRREAPSSSPEARLSPPIICRRPVRGTQIISDEFRTERDKALTRQRRAGGRGRNVERVTPRDEIAGARCER